MQEQDYEPPRLWKLLAGLAIGGGLAFAIGAVLIGIGLRVAG